MSITDDTEMLEMIKDIYLREIADIESECEGAVRRLRQEYQWKKEEVIARMEENLKSYTERER